MISKYIKKCNNVDINNIQDAWLSWLKSYLKILNILYIMEGTHMPINSKMIEMFIKLTYIFDNINITSKPCIIKVSLKSNMAIV